MSTIFKKMLFMTALAGVVMGLIAGTATASTQNGGWTHLGGDPLVAGGINSRSDFVQLITSSKGTTAMRYAGMTPSEIRAVQLAARMGQFRSCRLKYGMHFVRMSFGINGTSVDQNVTFLDPHYRGSGAAAFCMDVRVGNEMLHVLVPRKCANISVINRTKVKPIPKAPKPKVPTPKPVPKPTPPPTGSCNAINSPGAVVCSTFYVFVTCGGAQITINGSTKEEAIANAKAYSDSHDCNTVVITTPPTPPPPIATCQDKTASNFGGPLPCVFPPPPVVSPPMASMNFVQETYASTSTNPSTSRVCGHVKANSGDVLSISFKANYGHFDNPNYSPLTANGSDQEVCATYTSPTEVGVKDQITLNELDTTTKLSASSPSNLFDIIAAPINPA